MNINKAIEILADLELTDSLDLEPDEKDAITLAIEIMKCSLKDTVARRP